MKISEVYRLFNEIGVLTFSTMYNNEVVSRAAHFNGFDEDGIYFRTMWNKPFARQIEATGKVTVLGISDTRVLSHKDDHTPEFPPGYSIRLIGEVKALSEDEVREKAKINQDMKLAEVDMDKYTAMRKGNFVIHKAKIEVFDFDFECKNRDHKILRTRTSFGGMKYNEAGPHIKDSCVACGLCKDVCTFKAIEEGRPFKVVSSKCDDCGSCIEICPVHAIEPSKMF